MTYASARQIVFDAADAVNAPDRITVAESAAKNLRIITPEGADLGTWSAELAPYMVEPMNLQTSRLFDAVAYVGAARSSKTLSLVDGGIAATIVDDPADCGVFHMTEKTAEIWAEQRLERGIQGSPELKARLSPHAHDDNTMWKKFRNGTTVEVGWQSKSSMSGKDLRRVYIPDADNATGALRIAESFGFGLARIRTYGSNGIVVVEGSPAEDCEDPGWRQPKEKPHLAPPAKGLLSIYNTGDRRRWYWPCPDCGHRFMAKPGLANFAVPDIDELREMASDDDIPGIAARLAMMPCPRCAVLIEPRHRSQMNLAGCWLREGEQFDGDRIIGTPLQSRRATFWAGGVMSCFDTWQAMWERWLYAIRQWDQSGDTHPAKTEMNTGQAMPFSAAALKSKRTDSDPTQRATGEWEPGTVPDGVRFLLCMVDVQAGRRAGFPCLIVGIGVNGQRWVVDRFHLRSSKRLNPHPESAEDTYLRLDPATYPEDWGRLTERCVTRACALANDPARRVMAIKFVACDSGGKGGTEDDSGDKQGGVTQNANIWWRQLRAENLAHKVLLVKGTGNVNAPVVEMTWPDGRQRKDRHAGNVGDVPLLLINSNRVKDVVHAGIARTEGAVWHFPRWLKQNFFDEINAETKTGGTWKQIGNRPNEALDQLVYLEAMLEHLGVNQPGFWAQPQNWAQVWDRNPLVYYPDQPPTPVQQLQRRPASDYWNPRR